MPKVSIISHFYNHPQRVQEHVAYWESLPPAILSKAEFILIDDCSQELPRLSTARLDLKVFRITTDVLWNQSGARNLGAFNASGSWAIYFDIDQKFNSGPMETVFNHIDGFDDMTMYYLRSDNQFEINVREVLPCHPNTYIVNLRNFRLHGMFDEDFAGYYGYEDLYMPRVWERHGGKRVILADQNYFEDMGFGTTNLDRDSSRNKLLAEQKLAAGVKNSPGMLRFEWEKVEIGTV